MRMRMTMKKTLYIATSVVVAAVAGLYKTRQGQDDNKTMTRTTTRKWQDNEKTIASQDNRQTIARQSQDYHEAITKQDNHKTRQLQDKNNHKTRQKEGEQRKIPHRFYEREKWQEPICSSGENKIYVSPKR
jgi:hypothetical protein